MTITNDKDVANIRDFDYLAFKACMIGGGRIIIAVPNDTTTEIRIAAAIAWYPPRNRAKISNILKGGILGVIRNWGLVSLSVCYSDSPQQLLCEQTTHSVCPGSRTAHILFANEHSGPRQWSFRLRQVQE